MFIPIVTSYNCLNLVLDFYISVNTALTVVITMSHRNNTYCHFYILLFIYFIYYYNLLSVIYNNYFTNRGAYLTLVIFQAVNYIFYHPFTNFFS